MITHQSSNLAFCFSLCFFITLNFFSVSVDALNVTIPAGDPPIIPVNKECSRKCESEFCTVPPLLRYGKYCGLLYSGCPGEKPCDGLDACCMKHDECVQAKNNGYLSQECSQTFIDCVINFQKSDGKSFKGSKCKISEVMDVINVVMEAALFAGKVLHKP